MPLSRERRVVRSGWCALARVRLGATVTKLDVPVVLDVTAVSHPISISILYRYEY